tara:strand:+ start:4080 stop:4688 length:609 start_codon:yes stop_codon:yes gene_type:complete
MAIILASFSTSNVADFNNEQKRETQGESPISMESPLGLSIAGNLSDTLPEAKTLEIVNFLVSGVSEDDNNTWVNAYGFTQPTNIEAMQVYLEVPDEDIDANLEFLQPLIGLIWRDSDTPNGLTLKRVREVGSASDEEIAFNSNFFESGLKQELPNIVIESLHEEGESSVTSEKGKASVTSLYIMGFATLGVLYCAYKKSTNR